MNSELEYFLIEKNNPNANTMTIRFNKSEEIHRPIAKNWKLKLNIMISKPMICITANIAKQIEIVTTAPSNRTMCLMIVF